MSGFQEVLGSMSQRERDAFMEHVNGGTSARKLSSVLKKHGIKIGKTTINRYRKGVQ